MASPTHCQAADCDRTPHARGLCKHHYDADRAARGVYERKPTKRKRRSEQVPRATKPTHCVECNAEGTHAKGWCRSCYDHWRTQRGVFAPKPKPRAFALEPTATPHLDLLLKVLRDLPKLDGDCKDFDPRVFDGETEADVTAALAVCAGCPLRQQCREWALGDASGLTTGIVGGTVLGAQARAWPNGPLDSEAASA